MKAAVYEGKHNVVVRDWPMPALQPGHVLVEVKACGVCGTDRHIYEGEYYAEPPVVIGHEFSGAVVAVGEGVTDLQPGDRVAVDPNIQCGTCRACHQGKVHLCSNASAIGVNYDGGFAEYCVAPRRQIFPFPAHLDWASAAMAEPLACCLHGADLAEVRPGQTVLVIGGGAIGQIHAQLARLSGASRVVVSDPVASRRTLALQLGADAVLDPKALSLDEMRSSLDGGADVVIEAVGSVATAEQSVALAAPGATVVWFGVATPGAQARVEPYDLFRREITIRGAFVNPFTHSRSLALLASGRVQVAPLITRKVALDDLPAILAEGPGDAVKVMMVRE